MQNNSTKMDLIISEYMLYYIGYHKQDLALDKTQSRYKES